MSALSNYAEDELLDHLLGTTALAAPTNVYLALFTDSPAEDGSGTELTGLTGYAREEIAWDASSGGLAANDALIEFTAGEDWGTISHIGIYDAATAGNLLLHAALTTPRVIDDGNTLRFAIGAVVASLA